MTCKRHIYIWLPAGSREIPVTGNLYMLDLGLCQQSEHVTEPRDFRWPKGIPTLEDARKAWEECI